METNPTNIENLERQLAEMREELHNTREDLKNALDHADKIAYNSVLPDISEEWLQTIFEAAMHFRATILGKALNPELSELDRRRLMGAGVRRYGFIDKVSDIMITSPSQIPDIINVEEFKGIMRMLEITRNTDIVLQQTVRINGDFLLVLGNEAYRMALVYYGFIREAARRGVPGAEEIFRELRKFFVRRPGNTNEPTEHEIERDVHALLHGTKDGKIVIENEHPHTHGGKHIVEDQTHKPNNNKTIEN